MFRNKEIEKRIKKLEDSLELIKDIQNNQTRVINNLTRRHIALVEELGYVYQDEATTTTQVPAHYKKIKKS